MAAAASQNYYELYRGTSIGLALADTLDDLISSRRIEPQLAMRIMSHFDARIAEVLGEKVKARLTFKVGCVSKNPASLGTVPCWGHLDTYRFCDEVWTFILKDVKFKMDNAHQAEAERVKIVACQSKDKQEK
ncbi:hypothetical protein KC345_g2098 [Hortaea werneckii]|nr:hypothetical protein KC345_g2098 [Hortaea werneckii]